MLFFICVWGKLYLELPCFGAAIEEAALNMRDSHKALVAGAGAGSVETVVTMPFEVTKNRLQLKCGPPGMLASIADTIRRAGVGGLYYGMQPAIAQVAGKTALRYVAYEEFRSRTGNALLAGTLAGLVEALVWVAPTERLKVLRQTEVGGAAGSGGTASVARAAARVLAQQGVTGLWLGAGPTAARQMVANGARFAVFEKMKNYLTVWQAPAPAVLAGGCAGVFSVMLTNPVDVVKTHMQATPLTAGSGGTLVAVRELVASEGLGAFARGLSARAWKIGLGQAVIFGTYDAVRSHL